MSRHTPGPWTVRPYEGAEGSFAVVSEGVPYIGGTYIAGTIDGLPDGEEAANARLMAAAPDLWEALSLLVAAVRAPEGQSDRIDEALPKALAALNRMSP